MIHELVNLPKRAGAWTRRLARRRTKPRAFVLLYHRVARPTVDPWEMCVAPANFKAQVAILRRHTRILPLVDILTAAKSGKATDRPAAAITFDDGYVDNVEAALPILEEARAPATFFLATGWLGRARPFWWDRLAWILLKPQELPAALELDLADGAFRWECRWGGGGPDSPARRRLHAQLWASLRTQPDLIRDAVLDSLAEWSGSDARPDAAGRPMNEGEVQQLAKAAITDIGAHTVTHPFLPELSRAARRHEINESITRCGQVSGRDPRCFSYPHGQFDSATAAVVRDAGMAVACTGHQSLVTQDTDPMAVPRISVHDWSATAFERWLRWYWLP